MARLMGMLSIGKVGGGDGDPTYYTRTVARGHEDYYTGQGEAQGTWAGKAAKEKGFDGPVDEDDFISALTPPPGSERKLLGFDLTFSAPKSVSVLWAVADHPTSDLIRDAHDAAVSQALEYIERNAAFTRRGHAGSQVLQGDALTMALFRHRTSRAGDPQLHTHSVIVNELEADGRATSLFGRALYAHGRTAGFVYQAALRDQLTRTVGLDWDPVCNGVAEVTGVPEDVRRHFSQRRQEIREHLHKVGGRSARSAQISVLETRRAKDYSVPTDLHDNWRARAAEVGFGRNELAAVLDARASGRPRVPDEAVLRDDAAAPHGVTREASTFDRRDALRDFAEAHREGVCVADLERLTDRWLGGPATVVVDHGETRRHLGGTRYTTPSMLAVEQELVDTAVDRMGSGVAQADAALVTDALQNRPTLSDEQRELVRDVTLSGDGVQVVRAAAGTGKTVALGVARDAWEESGVRVFGCALAARAAVEMESLAGIDATTIARLLRDVDRGRGLPPRSVLIVDEAGMVGSRNLAHLARHCVDTDSKLLLVGDDRQLPEIDAGGAFRELAHRLGTSELHTVRRQNETWDREALAELRSGRVRQWAEAYERHGRITARPTAAETREALVDDWWEAARTREHDAVMIAHRRSDVAELNALARARLHRDGHLGVDELTTPTGRAFATGDHVLARRNDHRQGLVNGTRATVVQLDTEHATLVIRTADGKEHSVDRAYLDDDHLDHGYALTAHAAQGATVDRAYVLGSDELYREWGYTALSRHRDEAHFYVVSAGSTERALPGLEHPDTNLTDDLVEMLHPSHRKYTARETMARHDIPEPPPAELARREAAEARERAERLRAQADQTPIWKRKERARLERMSTTQFDAAKRWAEETEALRVQPAPRPDGRIRERVLEATRMELRDRLADDGGLKARRPDSFDERERWARDAARVLRSPSLAERTPVCDRSSAGPERGF